MNFIENNNAANQEKLLKQFNHINDFYLYYQSYLFEREDYGDFMYYQIYNDSFDYIDSISLYVGNQSIENDLGFDGYQNVFADIYYLSEDYYSVRSKIEDNHIYELAYVCDDVYYGILEERVYTINNDKLEYEVINTYTDLEIAGATC